MYMTSLTWLEVSLELNFFDGRWITYEDISVLILSKEKEYLHKKVKTIKEYFVSYLEKAKAI